MAQILEKSSSVIDSSWRIRKNDQARKIGGISPVLQLSIKSLFLRAMSLKRLTLSYTEGYCGRISPTSAQVI